MVESGRPHERDPALWPLTLRRALQASDSQALPPIAPHGVRRCAARCVCACARVRVCGSGPSRASTAHMHDSAGHMHDSAGHMHGAPHVQTRIRELTTTFLIVCHPLLSHLSTSFSLKVSAESALCCAAAAKRATSPRGRSGARASSSAITPAESEPGVRKNRACC